MLQISELLLRDFQGHSHTMLRLRRLNLACGGNAAGKSSLRRAIEWVLASAVFFGSVTPNNPLFAGNSIAQV